MSREMFLAALLALAALPAAGADWPQWRHDAGRTAASPGSLPDDLQPLWERAYGPREPVWLEPMNRDLMPYDRAFEPVVAGKRLFLPFNDRDKVVCLDTETGAERWTYYTDGPVRLPPAAWRDRVFVASDDGCLHALRAETGELIWKHAGAPAPRKALGNGRLISAWPARGGPVVVDGRVHYGAGIFPFMGASLYALDAETGRALRQDDASGTLYMRQPHNAPSIGGVAPQGALVAADGRLLVPCGRSVPACFDLAKGNLLHYRLAENGKTGGSFVCATGPVYLNYDREGWTNFFDAATGTRLVGRLCRNPVLTPDTLYGAGESLEAFDLEALRKKPKGSKDARRWSVACDASGDLIRAGNRLYAAGGKRITALDLGADPPKPCWTHDVAAPVGRLLAADGKLFAVTMDGRLLAFGKRTGRNARPAAASPAPPRAASAAAATILERTGAREGWALVWGGTDAAFLAALAEASGLRIVAVRPDAAAVDTLRRELDARGLYGRRVTVHAGTPGTFRAPPFVASLSVLAPPAKGGAWSAEALAAAFRSVRPYGGILCADAKDAAAPLIKRLTGDPRFPGAKALEAPGLVGIRRDGPLPGAAPWTHQNGGIANTVKSDDTRVRLPLALQWFGGTSNADILPRHGHGPPQQVIGGRLFIEGIDSLSAWDVYTGRVLWKAEVDKLGTFGVYYDRTYTEAPTRTSYNQVHIPGANVRGANYVATADRVYVARGGACRVLDAVTGKTIRDIPLPAPPAGESVRPEWGYIGVHGDTLLGGWGVETYSVLLKGFRVKLSAMTNFDASTSRGLIALDRHTGAVRWRVKAGHGFLHNGIAAGGGKVFCLDRIPPFVAEQTKAAGPFRLVAFDLRTGQTAWEMRDDVFGTWLAYSDAHDVILQSGRPSRDMVKGESGRRMAAFRGRDGKKLWDRPHGYGSPPILHGGHVLTPQGRYDLLTGDPVPRRDPITGAEVPWTFQRAYGCNYELASEHLITFRSGAAGFYDLAGDGGTGNLGGFKSGCTSNLIAADGILSAPDYTRTCSCSYPTQTSLALVHDPGGEFWTVAPPGLGKGPLRRIGINLGAPGDRRDGQGTYWIEHPVAGGASPAVDVSVRGADAGYYRLHAARLAGDGLRWVAASGLRGAAVVRIVTGGAAETEGAAGIPVADGADDAEESPQGKVSTGSSDLELVEDKSPQVVGLRFRDVALPRNGRIAKAYVQFQVDETGGTKTDLTLHAEASDNAPPFQEKPRNLSARARTRASVTWRPAPWNAAGERGAAQRTPDLAPLIREVIARPGWKRGNAIALFVTGRGKRVAESFNGDRDGAPRLVLVTDAPADRPAAPPAGPRFTVRLHFAEPDDVRPGDRRFDVLLQGKPVLTGFDVAREAGGVRKALVRTFRGIASGDAIEVEVRPAAGCARPPLLGGVELIAE